MNFQKLTIIICSIFLLIGCSKDEIRDEISYEIIEENSLSYPEENKIPKNFLVFKSDNEWLNFIPEIERVNPKRAENLRNLNIDFTNYNLIIVIGEFFNYCCSEITINRVYKKGKKIIVDFEESGPGSATELSQAFLILKIRKED